MKECIETEYNADQTVKAVLSYSESEETIDGSIDTIKLQYENAGDENDLAAIELNYTENAEAIELLSNMMKMEKNEAWEYFLKIFPAVLAKSDAYEVTFTNGKIRYKEWDQPSLIAGPSGGAMIVNQHRKAYYLRMNTGKYAGEELNITRLLFNDPQEQEEITDEEVLKRQALNYIGQYKDLFLKMKNGTMDRVITKALMLHLLSRS